MTLSPRMSYAIIGFLAGLFMLSTQVEAQMEATDWSPPELIAETEGDLASGTMVFFADPYGRLHLLYPERPDDATPLAFSYITWNGSSWTDPIDVLYDTSGGNLANSRGILDAQDTLHLIWGGTNYSLRYASVALDDIGVAAAWPAPITLAVSLSGGDIATSSAGKLFIAYGTDLEARSIVLITSDDGGRTWSTPVTAAVSPLHSSVPREIRLAVDERGRLHLVWTDVQLPNGWPPTGAYYARSVDGGLSWEEPQQIATEGHGQLGIATVGDDEIHLVWRSTIGGDGTFHQRSIDGGASWLPQTRHDDQGGFSGLPSFAVDTAGIMHLAIGAGYYARWENNQLSPFRDVSTPELRAAAESSPAERTLLAITSGNEVHVVFENDFRTLWHRYRVLPLAPSQTAITRVSPTPQLRAESNKASEREANNPKPVTSSLVPVPGSQPWRTPVSRVTPLLLSSGISALLVLFVFIVIVRKRMR